MKVIIGSKKRLRTTVQDVSEVVWDKLIKISSAEEIARERTNTRTRRRQVGLTRLTVTNSVNYPWILGIFEFIIRLIVLYEFILHCF